VVDNLAKQQAAARVLVKEKIMHTLLLQRLEESLLNFDGFLKDSICVLQQQVEYCFELLVEIDCKQQDLARLLQIKLVLDRLISAHQRLVNSAKLALLSDVQAQITQDIQLDG
jgi:hypothetical protein